MFCFVLFGLFLGVLVVWWLGCLFVFGVCAWEYVCGVLYRVFVNLGFGFGI